MDFKELQAKAKKYTKQLSETVDKQLDKWIEKIENSSFVISKKEDLEKVIEETKNTENSYGKISRKKTIVICVEKGSDFYKHLLSYMLPVIYWKAWTQNVGVKLCNLEQKELKKYDIGELPALVIFADTKVEKVIHGKEKIEKVVKNTNMDINDVINKL